MTAALDRPGRPSTDCSAVASSSRTHHGRRGSGPVGCDAREPLQEDLDTSTVLASVPPAEHVQLEPDRVVWVPFTLRVPDRLLAPTVRTPEFEVRWALQAVLDRALRRDARVRLDLLAATTE